MNSVKLSGKLIVDSNNSLENLDYIPFYIDVPRKFQRCMH